MKLGYLLEKTGVATAYADTDITALCRDSRKVTEGCAFVCITGTGVDSHQFAAQALENGAAVVVVERDLGLSRQVLVENSRTVWAQMSAAWFGYPSERLHLIGVTGTNGLLFLFFILPRLLSAFRYSRVRPRLRASPPR